MGIYVVSVGYFAAGIPGAIAGWLAMVTPAFTAIPLMRFVGRRATEHPRFRSALNAAVLASAGLVVATIEPLAREAVTGWLTFSIAIASFAVLAVKRVDTIWVIAGAAVSGLAAALLAG
jgi:chromate transporter